jgi:hypothetical protein
VSKPESKAIVSKPESKDPFLEDGTVTPAAAQTSVTNVSGAATDSPNPFLTGDQDTTITAGQPPAGGEISPYSISLFGGDSDERTPFNPGVDLTGQVGDVTRGIFSGVPFGINQPKPETPAGQYSDRISNFVGTGLATVATLGGAGAVPTVLNALNRSSAGRAVSTLIQSVSKNPGTTASVNAAVDAVIGGAYEGIEQNVPYGDKVMLGDIPLFDLKEMYQGLTLAAPAAVVPAVKGSLKLIERTPVVGGAYRWVKTQAGTLVPERQRQNAVEALHKMLKTAGVDIDDLLGNLTAGPSGLRLTTGEITQNQQLLAVARELKALDDAMPKLREGSPDRSMGYTVFDEARKLGRVRDLAKTLKKRLKGTGDPKTLRQRIQEQYQGFVTSMQGDIGKLTDDYMMALKNIKPSDDPFKFQKEFKDGIEALRSTYHAVQEAKWKGIDKSMPANREEVEDLVALYNKVLGTATEKDFIPGEVGELLRGIAAKHTAYLAQSSGRASPAEVVTVEELHAVRTRALEHLRKPYNPNTGGTDDRLAKKFRDQAYKGMLASVSPAAQVEIRAASALTGGYYDTFYRGAVGNLYRGRYHDPAVRDNVSLQAMLKADQSEARANVIQVLDTARKQVGGNMVVDMQQQNQLRAQMSAHLEDQVYSQFVAGGKVNGEGLLKWVTGTKPNQGGVLLEEFGSLRSRLIALATSKKRLVTAESDLKIAKKAHELSAAGKVLGSSPTKLADDFWEGGIVKYKLNRGSADDRMLDADEFMKELVVLAKKDLSGDSLRGLQTSVREALFRRIATGDRLEGQSLLDARTAWNNVMSRLDGLKPLYGKKEMERLRTYMRHLEKTMTPKSGPAYAPEPPGAAVVQSSRLFATWLSGRFGLSAGAAGPSMQQVSFLSSFTKWLTKKFTTQHYRAFQADLIDNPKMFEEYMGLVQSGKLEEFMSKKLFTMAWPAGSLDEQMVFNPVTRQKEWGKLNPKTGKYEVAIRGAGPKVKSVEQTPLSVYFTDLINRELQDAPSNLTELMLPPPEPEESQRAPVPLPIRKPLVQRGRVPALTQ